MSDLFSLKRKKSKQAVKSSINQSFEFDQPETIENGPRIDTEILKQSIAEKMKLYKS